MFYFSGSAEARRAHGDPRRIRFRSETRSDRQGRLAQIHGLQNNRLSAYIEFFKTFLRFLRSTGTGTLFLLPFYGSSALKFPSYFC